MRNLKKRIHTTQLFEVQVTYPGFRNMDQSR